MGTVSGAIHAGVPHPNDDGLVRASIQSVWLTENSRPSWSTAGATKFISGSIWKPSCPREILRTGISFVAAEALALQETGTEDLRPLLSSRLIDFGKLNDPEVEGRLWALVCEAASASTLKFIVCGFHRSTILDQLECLDDLKCDIEVLHPVDTRLYCRWSEQVRRTGRFTDQVSR